MMTDDTLALRDEILDLLECLEIRSAKPPQVITGGDVLNASQLRTRLDRMPRGALDDALRQLNEQESAAVRAERLTHALETQAAWREDETTDADSAPSGRDGAAERHAPTLTTRDEHRRLIDEAQAIAQSGFTDESRQRFDELLTRAEALKR